MGLLATLASELNKKLEGLDQLLQKQAMFCKESTFTMNSDVRDVDHKFTLQIKREDTKWTLQKMLMQLVHPNQQECSFFHAMDHNRNGSSIMIAMLPNIAQHGCTTVYHLLPFTKWILKPILSHSQAKKVATAFTVETSTRQMTWQWDPANNCVLQVDSTLIGRALNDFPLYILTMTPANYQQPLLPWHKQASSHQWQRHYQTNRYTQQHTWQTIQIAFPTQCYPKECGSPLPPHKLMPW